MLRGWRHSRWNSVCFLVNVAVGNFLTGDLDEVRLAVRPGNLTVVWWERWKWWLSVWSGHGIWLATSATLQEPVWCVHVDACRWQCMQVSSGFAEVCEDWLRMIDAEESCSSRVLTLHHRARHSFSSVLRYRYNVPNVAYWPGQTAFYRPSKNWSNRGPGQRCSTCNKDAGAV